MESYLASKLKEINARKDTTPKKENTSPKKTDNPENFQEKEKELKLKMGKELSKIIEESSAQNKTNEGESSPKAA